MREFHSRSSENGRGEEAFRLATLRRYAILDKPKEGVFDCITEAAGAVCNAPMCGISPVVLVE